MKTEHSTGITMMKKKSYLKIMFLCLMGVTALCFEVQGFESRFLNGVQVVPNQLNFNDAADIQITWQQAIAGKVEVMICDLDGNIVQTLANDSAMTTGVHSVNWDGKDLYGRPCPAGVYLPIIKVKTDRGSVNVHNPTSSAWGSELILEPPVYDPDSETITFHLPQPALCLLRIGKARGGPCYGTLLNWEPKQAGAIELHWDGKDAQGVVDLGEREHVDFRLITIALPQSAVIISTSPEKSYAEDAKFQTFPLHPAHGENVFIHARHQRRMCRDFNITAKIIPTARKWWGRSVMRGSVSIDVGMVKDEHYRYFKREQFEIYLYVDDQYIREEKKPDVPASIALDTTKLTNGVHIVTVGLRTLDDHMGTYTMKINVDNP